MFLGLNFDNFKGQLTFFSLKCDTRDPRLGKMTNFVNILEMQKLFLDLSIQKASKWDGFDNSQGHYETDTLKQN